MEESTGAEEELSPDRASAAAAQRSSLTVEVSCGQVWGSLLKGSRSDEWAGCIGRGKAPSVVSDLRHRRMEVPFIEKGKAWEKTRLST